ncbi:MAG: HAD-IC family P-type ATPase [Bacilli bacterium]|jgi:cation-transporting ATPase E|nr:HAD-IC family P-type ATPase [Bacilli bacterium]
MKDITRYNPSEEMGLSKEQVLERMADGLVNFDDQPKTKSIKQIIASNFFTYFNFLNICLGVAVFSASLFSGQLFQGIKNCLFMGVIIVNSIISIIEEIISKKIIDQLSILSESKVNVIRDGETQEKAIDEIVLDDVILLKSGHQVVCDAIVLSGEVEVNEAFVTGESDAIVKSTGDMILSGSFIVSGMVRARVEHIGSENYVSTISAGAKYMKKANSVIMDSFEKLLRIISFFIVPIGIIMYFSQLNATNFNVTEAIFATVAALIGMIPEGLVLLTSSVMAVSVIRLSRYRVLVQQLHSMETLARVDVICLDKTGTLTEGKMALVKICPADSCSKEEMEEIIGAITVSSMDENATMKCLKEANETKSDWVCQKQIAFSSSRKFSAFAFEKQGSFYLGAPEILFRDNKKIREFVAPYQSDYRVLVLAKSKEDLTNTPSKLQFLGYLLIEDVIRPEAKDTLSYFKDQGVSVKIISGDNVETVLSIAKRVGLLHVSGIDVSSFSDDELYDVICDYDVYGRVAPRQKQLIIQYLQEMGHTVAMTGDGVNDVLALKTSDCGIALASGSESARNVSQLVLLDSNFDSLPKVVAEGRRTINNIERSSSLLLVKTIYTVLLILFSILISTKYFFVPIQLTLITGFTIGIPSFILALEPNRDLVTGNFLLKIVSKSLPVALTVVFNIILITAFRETFQLSYSLSSTLSVFLTATTGFLFLYQICRPFNFLRTVLFLSLLFGFVYCALFQYEFFNISEVTNETFLIFLVLYISSMYIYDKLNRFSRYLFHKFDPSIV